MRARTRSDIRTSLAIASGAHADQAIKRCQNVLNTVRWYTA
jgi:hypothetical protein